MEALWNLEDKLNLSTQEALILFVCAAFAVVAICTATVLKKMARRPKQLLNHDKDISDDSMRPDWSEPSCGWFSMKKVLTGSVRWSRANKWEEKKFGGLTERPTPLLGLEGCEVIEMGWQSHNSVSPVWQRPILMGEKCELPRFSGRILYDERGQLLGDSQTKIPCKENTHPQVRKPSKR